jgi:hypothetical protein
LELVAVNSGDSPKIISQYVKELNLTFPIGMDSEEGGKYYGVADKYGVQAYPTNYVLDSSGKVVWRGVGFDEEGIRAALEKLGVR